MIEVIAERVCHLHADLGVNVRWIGSEYPDDCAASRSVHGAQSIHIAWLPVVGINPVQINVVGRSVCPGELRLPSGVAYRNSERLIGEYVNVPGAVMPMSVALAGLALCFLQPERTTSSAANPTEVMDLNLLSTVIGC